MHLLERYIRENDLGPKIVLETIRVKYTRAMPRRIYLSIDGGVTISFWLVLAENSRVAPKL